MNKLFVPLMERLSEQTAYHFLNEAHNQSVLVDIHLLLDVQGAAKITCSIFSCERAHALSV